MASADRSIQNLISRYAFLVDGGDFAGVGALLDDAEFQLGPTRVHGRGEVESLAKSVLEVYADGTPRTRHVTTNLIIDIDEDAGTATSRSYFTVFQQTDTFPLQPIACGHYEDRFERHNQTWRFSFRSVNTTSSATSVTTEHPPLRTSVHAAIRAR